MPGVGRNSYKAAMQKSKQKNNSTNNLSKKRSSGDTYDYKTSQGPKTKRNDLERRIYKQDMGGYGAFSDMTPGSLQKPKYRAEMDEYLYEQDRSPLRMPTQDPIMRMVGGFPRATPRYTKGFPRPLKDIPSGDEGKGLRKMAQSGEGAEQVKEFGYDPNSALARHMKFCGGASKPYKKK